MRGRSCVVVHGRARSCVVVRSRACVVVHGRARSCVVGRARSCVRGRSFVVVRGRAVLPASRPALSWHERMNERTSNNPLNPPWGGVGQFFLFV